ncbi:MAG: SDR family NAD(P)-dependent oxidoreductase [Acidobacteriota bacterium]
MDLGLGQTVAIVTGGARGIGRAAAAALLGEGARVVVASRRADSVAAAVATLLPLGTVEGIACDVTVERDVVRLVSETTRRFGRLDILVANAGIAGESVNLADMPVEEWDRVIAVHMRGTFLCGRESARAMRSAGRGGRIVTLASTSAYEADRHSGHYNAAKSGIVGLTRSMAVDFAPWGIRVNGVAPGWVRTDMTAPDLPPPGSPIENCGVQRRAVGPEEIAAAITFLASDVCRFATGTTLVVDGGQLIVAPDPSGPERAR